MKVVHVPEIDTRCTTLPDALDAVCGGDMMRSVHGPDDLLRYEEWGQDDRRRIEFRVRLGGNGENSLPPEIRDRLLPSSSTDSKSDGRLHVVAHQRLERCRPDTWEVHNRLRFKVLGAELFSVRPTYWLRKDHARGGTVTLGGRVEHRARLPPPFNGVVEAFMADSTKRQLADYARHMLQRGQRLVPGTLSTANGRPPRWVADIMRDWNRACLGSFEVALGDQDDSIE